VRIVVYGAGPVGLTTALSFSFWGHDVLCIDKHTKLIQRLSAGETDYFETDLNVQLKLAVSQKNIHFTNDPNIACDFSDI